MKQFSYKMNIWGVLLLIVAPLYSQSICHIQEYSSDNGIAQRNISNIQQDQKGFIWFTTWNGLGKYDGYKFQKFLNTPYEDSTNPIGRINLFRIGSDNTIWCQTEHNQVYLFDTQKETFKDLFKAIGMEKKANQEIQRFYFLPNGITWVKYQDYLLRINPQWKAEKVSIPGVDLSIDSSIINIQQDAEGNEWIFTHKGIHIIGSRTIDRKDIPFNNMIDDGDCIYLISVQGVFAKYDKATEKLQHIDIPFPCSTLNWIHPYNDDELYLGSNNLIFVYNKSNKSFQQLDFSNFCQRLVFAYQDSHNELWFFGQKPGVIHYNPNTNEKRLLHSPTQSIPQSELQNTKTIFEDKQNTLWLVPNEGGLCYYDRSDKQLKSYYIKEKNNQTAYAPTVYDPFYDGNNNFWFTDRYHLSKVTFYPHANQFHPIDEGYETRAFLKEQSGNLWIATKKGNIRIYSPDKQLIGYLAPSGNISRSPISFNRNVYCFMQDIQGNIWMGTKKDGVILLTPKGKNGYQVKQFLHDPNQAFSLSNNSVYSIYQDSQRRIWFGTFGGGLNLLDTSHPQELRFLHSLNTPQIPGGRFSKVRTIKEIDNHLFIGTQNGLLVASSEFQHMEQCTFYPNIHRPDDNSSLTSNNVMNIFQDRLKNIYIQAFTGGINQIESKEFQTEQIRFRHYTEENGLPSNLVYSMLEDSEGNLWVIAEDALFRFNPQTTSFENYLQKHLQQETSFSETEPLLWNNKLLLGTNGGYMEIDPTRLKINPSIPPIILTELYIQGEKLNISIDNLKYLELFPDQRDISIHFVTPDYADPTKIKYTYRLKGLQDTWSKADNNRQASYINLPPGNYEFQVKSTNSDGLWGETIKSLSIHVKPTFWETHWATLLYIALSILFTLVVVYIFFVIFRLRHRINLEKQLTHIKLRFFTDISHELRTPLTLITSPVSEVLEHEPLSPNARKYLEIVHENTEQMLQLVNQILDFRKIENQKMKLLLEQTEIVAQLHKLMSNFNLMAEEKQINFTFQTQETELYAWIDYDKFQKIILNLISNAFKYTPNGKAITLSLKVKDKRFTVGVKDEGNGISPDKLPHIFQRFETLVKDNILQPSSGIGLSLVKELVDLHLGNIYVNSQIGIGSEFTVELPFMQESYADIDYKEFILDDSKSAFPLADTEDTIMPTVSEDTISILIVEDNTTLRTFLRDILAEHYKVIEATNGQEGLELAHQQVPDFIISDIMMPVMDGLDMVKAIKEDKDICHIPIILLSAKSSLDDRINGLEQGVDDYITKPFSSTYLKTRIRLLLQQRKQLQQRFMEQYTQTSKNSYLEPSPIQITSLDKQFMDKVKEVVEKHIEDCEFSIDQFAQETNMGRTTFYQKLKNITGLSPIEFLQTMRIKRAIQLIDTKEYNISTIAYMCGFNDAKYFGKCFKKHIGVTPSEYSNQQK